MSLTVTSSSRSTNALPPFLASRACAGGAATGDGAGSAPSRSRSSSSRGARAPLRAAGERLRGLGAGDRAGQLGGVGVLVAGDRAGGEHAVGERVGHEARGRLVVAAPSRRPGAAATSRGPCRRRRRAGRSRARARCPGGPRPTRRPGRRRDAGERLAAGRADDGRALVELDAELLQRAAASGRRRPPVRRSATARISTPASRSARAATRPRSPVVATTAALPGRTP